MWPRRWFNGADYDDDKDDDVDDNEDDDVDDNEDDDVDDNKDDDVDDNEGVEESTRVKQVLKEFCSGIKPPPSLTITIIVVMVT